MRKHLIFHFCVNESTGWAKAHIDKLERHIDLFDGYRFFSICEPNDNLKDNKLVDRILKLANSRTTINYIKNDTISREVKPFFDMHLPALKLLKEENDYCFYGHTKGSSHGYSNALNAWNTTLWKYNIEKYEECIAPHIGNYKTIGCLRKTREKAGANVGDYIIESFHFSGTFFWFSCDILNRDDWFDPNRSSPWVIERWPGIISDLSDSISVFDLEESEEYYYDHFWDKHNVKGDMQL